MGLCTSRPTTEPLVIYIAQARTEQKCLFHYWCSLVAREIACPQNCSRATAIVLSPVYTAVTLKWVYMSHDTYMSIKGNWKNLYRHCLESNPGPPVYGQSPSSTGGYMSHHCNANYQIQMHLSKQPQSVPSWNPAHVELRAVCTYWTFSTVIYY
jgi:hypothetical protein